MKILVLGGTGLIGSAIVEQLVARGDEVHVRNRGQTEDHLPASVVRTVGDRAELVAHREAIEREHFSCVIDMCGYSVADAKALAKAVAGAVPHVIYCSSTDALSAAKHRGVYPLSEATARGAPPTFPYAANKVASEETLEEASRAGAFALTIIRPAEIYGNADYGPLHPLWHRNYNLWRLQSGLPLILHNEGTSLWCACHADDAAVAFVNAAGNPQAFGRVYNVAGLEWATWRRYWETVAEAFELPAPRFVGIPASLLVDIFGPETLYLAENFRFNNVVDCARAEAELGFAYRTDLRTGFGQVAARYGPRWLEDGRAQANDSYAERYEATLSWWAGTSNTSALPH